MRRCAQGRTTVSKGRATTTAAATAIRPQGRARLTFRPTTNGGGSDESFTVCAVTP